MIGYIDFADRLSAWFGKAFGWLIIVMTFGVSWEVFLRYVVGAPTVWSFDVAYIMYGTLFMMAGAYTLSKGGHVRGDFIYRLWPPRIQARIELVLYIFFFFPGVIALVLSGWKYAARGWQYLEVSINSPVGIPVFQFKSVIVAAGILLIIQGIAQVFRCLHCLRTGVWLPPAEERGVVEQQSLAGEAAEILRHGSEAVDVVRPAGDNNQETRS